MPIVSYAQNFEDVLLWRALHHVGKGTYIDIGAQHPTVDSVSKAFYEQGWRGIHVEPISYYAELLRKDRPDETVFQLAISDQPRALTFYEIPGTGMSTGSEEIADTHRRSGWVVVVVQVAAITLDQLFSHVDCEHIHWLKIDVEGLERAVLEGWHTSSCRPWIVVVESTYPSTQTEIHHLWEHLLTAKGYAFVHFDGLNRYYVSDAHGDLHRHFRYGPSMWDEFQLPETSRHVSSLMQHHNAAPHWPNPDIARQCAAIARAQAVITALSNTLSNLRKVDRTREELSQIQQQLDQMRDTLHSVDAKKRRMEEEWLWQCARLVTEVEATIERFRQKASVLFDENPTFLSVASDVNSECPFGEIESTPPRAHSLDELFAHSGEAFVRCAYITLLGRPADPEGLRDFLERLMLGTSRKTIVAVLSICAEGRRYGARLPGLNRLVRRHRLLNWPLVGGFFRLLDKRR